MNVSQCKAGVNRLMGRKLYCESEELAFVCDTTCMQVVLLLALVCGTTYMQVVLKKVNPIDLSLYLHCQYMNASCFVTKVNPLS